MPGRSRDTASAPHPPVAYKTDGAGGQTGAVGEVRPSASSFPGRPGNWPPTESHPLLAPVGEHLVLPDRDGRLEPVDQGARGVVRLATVGGGGGHDDGDVADLAGARCGARRRARRTSNSAATSSATSRSRSSAVGWADVVEVVDLLAVVVVADGTDEQVHPAGRGILDGGEHLGGVERGLTQVQQAYDGGRQRGETSDADASPARSPIGRRPVIWAHEQRPRRTGQTTRSRARPSSRSSTRSAGPEVWPASAARAARAGCPTCRR